MKNDLDITENKKDKCNPKIFVACLASYNKGCYHGDWIDVTQDEETLSEEIQKILSSSLIPNAEEWIILGGEYFSSLKIDKCENIKSVCEKAQFIQEHGELGAAVFEYYGGIEEAREALDDYYYGEWDREIDFAIDLFDQIYAEGIPENVRRYIDYEAFSDDIFINDYFSLKIGEKTHVFSVH